MTLGVSASLIEVRDTVYVPSCHGIYKIRRTDGSIARRSMYTELPNDAQETLIISSVKATMLF